MYCEIIDLLQRIFVEIQLKRKLESLKDVFMGARVWAPEPVYQSPKQP